MKKYFLIGLISLYISNATAQTAANASAGWNINQKDLPVYDLQKINTIFDSIRLTSGIEFGYPQGGCQQRAQILHAFLKGYGITHARVFIFAPSNLTPGSTVKLTVNDPTGLSANGRLEWGYHVAPCVSVKGNDGKATLLVIDPSLSDRALPLKDWFSKMGNASQSKYMLVQPDAYYFFLGNDGTVSGQFYKYEDLQDEKILSYFDNALVERELALNDVAIYLKKKVDGGYADPAGDIKKLVGNVNSLLSVFASQNNNTVLLLPETLRVLFDKHGALMEEAFHYYHTRAFYWVRTYKGLNDGTIRLGQN